MRSRLTRGAAAVVAAALALLTLGLVLLLHARLGAAVDDVLRQRGTAAGALVVLE